MTQLLALKAHIDAIDPRLWSLYIAFIVGGLVFSVKKWLPNVWASVPSRFKAVPPTIIAALLSSATSQTATQVIIDALLGGFSGLTAAGGHELGARLFSKPGKPAEPDPTPKDDAS